MFKAKARIVQVSLAEGSGGRVEGQDKPRDGWVVSFRPTVTVDGPWRPDGQQFNLAVLDPAPFVDAMASGKEVEIDVKLAK